jgi:sec-independent protein translocase protein TatB
VFSFSEIMLLGLVTLVAVGPKNLPQALGTLGKWVAKLRRIGNEVRFQIGVDDILRQEGLTGGLNELRSLMRGGLAGGIASAITKPTTVAGRTVYPTTTAADSRDVADDRSREYPPEGPDAYGAIPDDLLPEEKPAAENPAVAPVAAMPAPQPVSPAVTPAPPVASPAQPATPPAQLAALAVPRVAQAVVPQAVVPQAVMPPAAPSSRPVSVPPPPPSSRGKSDT